VHAVKEDGADVDEAGGGGERGADGGAGGQEAAARDDLDGVGGSVARGEVGIDGSDAPHPYFDAVAAPVGVSNAARLRCLLLELPR
jgi:hypothetical protein